MSFFDFDELEIQLDEREQQSDENRCAESSKEIAKEAAAPGLIKEDAPPREITDTAKSLEQTAQQPQPTPNSASDQGKSQSGATDNVQSLTTATAKSPELARKPASPGGGPQVLIRNGKQGKATKSVTAAEAVRHLLASPECSSQRDPGATLFQPGEPSRPIIFGAWFGKHRAPAVLFKAPDEELTAYLRSDPLGPFSNAAGSLEWKWGFNEDDWQRSVWKVDWHTLPQLGPRTEMFVPRIPGPGMLSLAPPRILAFVSALRAVNQACWSAITETLAGWLSASESVGWTQWRGSRRKLLLAVLQCFAEQRHFGIIEAQVRWGHRELIGQSHRDGATSLLHLGVTLGGERTMRVGVFPESDSPSNSGRQMPRQWSHQEEVNVWDEQVWRPEHLQDHVMKPGSVYLSSPFCFEHAVHYPRCTRSDPIIALMCRFGYSADLGDALNDISNDDMREVAAVISESLAEAQSRGQLRLPSVMEVMQHERLVLGQLDRMHSSRLPR